MDTVQHFVALPALLTARLRKLTTDSPTVWRLTKGAAWTLIGSAVARGLSLIAFVVIARVLGRPVLGQLGILQNTLNVFGTFAGLGLGITATKFIAEYWATDPARAGRVRALSSATAWSASLIVGVFLFVLARTVAVRCLGEAELSAPLKIGVIFLVFTAVNAAQNGVLAGFEDFKTIAIINFLMALLGFVSMIVGGVLLGINGVMWAISLTAVANWVCAHVAIRRACERSGVPYTIRNCWVERAILWKFSLPAVLGAVALAPAMWITNALLVNQPGGYAEMGAYTAVLRIRQIPEAVLTMIMAPWLPVLSQQCANNSKHQYARTMCYAFAISFLVLVPFSLCQIAVPSATLLPYGRDFQDARLLVQFLMFHGVLLGLFQPFGILLASRNRMWLGWSYTMCFSAVLLLCSVIFVPRYGAVGLAGVSAGTYVTVSLLWVAYYYRGEPRVLCGIRLGGLIVAALAMAIVCFLASRLLNPFWSGVVALCMVVTCFWRVTALIRPTAEDSVRQVECAADERAQTTPATNLTTIQF